MTALPGKKPRLLLAGGSHSDIPLIQAARRLGFHVITSGNRPDHIGHCHGDEYHGADFSDPDAILALARRLAVDALCSSCNDFSAMACAYTAGKLGLPGHDSYETALKIHHKDAYRRLASELGVPGPRAVGIVTVEQGLQAARELDFPLIVKPVDLTGGKGMTVVSAPVALTPALERALAMSRARRAVVEEFIEGTRHGFSALLVAGRVGFHFVDNEHYFLNPYMVAAAYGPGDVPPSVVQQLCQIAEDVAGRLTLRDGIFHVQFILKGGAPHIIEICRRAPGDLYIRWVELVTGIPYPEWIVRSSVGLPIPDLRQTRARGFSSRHCVMAERPGRVRDVVIHDSVRANIIESMMWWKPGDTIADVLTAKCGIVFLRFDSREEMLDKTERMHELVHVEIE